MSSKFFVALTSGDTISCLQGTQDYAQKLKDNQTSVRSSALYFYPRSLRKYILFSRSYPSAKHYDFFTNEVDQNIWSDQLADRSLLDVEHRGIPNTDKDQELFADCGAFQYWKQPVKEATFKLQGKIGRAHV